MLSKKMTFSLMSLITLLAFAFAFVADDAFAAAKPFEITIVGRTAATYTVTPGENEDPSTFSSVIVDLIVESAQPVDLLGGYDGDDDGDFDGEDVLLAMSLILGSLR